MIDVTGESVKNAVISYLLNAYPDISVYKESITNPSYPHFFVQQLSLSTEEERKGHYLVTYSMNIRYRNASDPSTDLRLQQDLDAMALSLNELNLIPYGDGYIRCTGNSTEKVDGVLHFNCSIVVQAVKKDTSEHIKLNNIQVGINGR